MNDLCIGEHIHSQRGVHIVRDVTEDDDGLQVELEAVEEAAES